MAFRVPGFEFGVHVVNTPMPERALLSSAEWLIVGQTIGFD
jgi:hypothetical protein